MQRIGAILLVIVMLASLAIAPPGGRAGGFATVHLDEPPGEVVAGQPWRFGFTVMQHDVTPVNVERAVVSATHRESGETTTTDAVQEGAMGHYVAEITLPQAGSWKWSITPHPFAPTSFESLTVVNTLAVSDTEHEHQVTGRPVRIYTGVCTSLGAEAFALSDVVPGATMKGGELLSTSGAVGPTAGVPVAISETTIEIPLAELLGAPYAITVHTGPEDLASSVACGAIAGQMIDGTLVVGLQPMNGSGDVGIATLTETSDHHTRVILYMMDVNTTPEPSQSGGEVVVEITTGPQGWTFAPGQIEVPVGTTVVWVNTTEVAHTITGEHLHFEDSGLFRSGETFRQTFTTPGEYDYWCGPHPDMKGTIIVT